MDHPSLQVAEVGYFNEKVPCKSQIKLQFLSRLEKNTLENNKRKQINQENNIDGSLYENYLNDLFSASIIQIMLFINQQECLIKNIAEYIKIRVETWRGFVIQTRVKLSTVEHCGAMPKFSAPASLSSIHTSTFYTWNLIYLTLQPRQAGLRRKGVQFYYTDI